MGRYEEELGDANQISELRRLEALRLSVQFGNILPVATAKEFEKYLKGEES